MTTLKTVVWTAIVVCFVRGLFVFDMGPSADHTYPTASGICLAGAVLAAAVMCLAETRRKS